ncbi:hypothetical protein EON65_45460 [archaeon]|nr:MAG: hypothetical protein EON65_45460 [archaeon]
MLTSPSFLSVAVVLLARQFVEMTRIRIEVSLCHPCYCVIVCRLVGIVDTLSAASLSLTPRYVTASIKDIMMHRPL